MKSIENLREIPLCEHPKILLDSPLNCGSGLFRIEKFSNNFVRIGVLDNTYYSLICWFEDPDGVIQQDILNEEIFEILLKKDLMISAIDSFDRAARNRGFEEGKKAIQQIMRKALGL